MNAKFLGALSLAAAVVFSAVIPADAQSCNGNGRGNRGNHFGWRNSNKGNHYGWRNNADRFANRMNGFGNNGFNTAGYNAFGPNSIQARPYWGQQTNLSDRVARLQNRLASGNLSPDRQARLQAELARLQTRQTGLNTYWTGRLTAEQNYLQQLLSSGTLNATQSARVQDRLNRILNVQNGISSGTGFYGNPSMLSGLRNVLGF